MNETSDHEEVLKIMLVGESGVGKTSLLLRFAEDKFDEEQPSTIGVDFKVKKMDISGRKLKLALWDTAGQERFRTLTRAYYRGAHGVILVYDCSQEEGMESVRYWLDQIRSFCSPDSAVVMLVANKMDLVDSDSAALSGKEFAAENSLLFVATSARTRMGVDLAFEELILKVLDGPLLRARGNKLSGTVPSVEDDSCSC